MGSGFSMVEVAGRNCSRNAMRQIITSTAPAPPNRCPMLDLVELTRNVLAREPAQRLMAPASALSFNGVPVPCALI